MGIIVTIRVSCGGSECSAMDAEPYGMLAALVDRLIAETNLDIKQIEELGGPDRATLYLIRRGVTSQPWASTLRRLARALASHHLTREVDTARMATYARQLFAAAGYGEVEPGDARARLEEALLDCGVDAATVRLWAAFIAINARVTVDELVRGIERFGGVTDGGRSIE